MCQGDGTCGPECRRCFPSYDELTRFVGAATSTPPKRLGRPPGHVEARHNPTLTGAERRHLSVAERSGALQEIVNAVCHYLSRLPSSQQPQPNALAAELREAFNALNAAIEVEP